MTDFSKNTATIALIALMSAAPMTAIASDTGSPEQAVDEDPDETVGQKKVNGDGSLVEDDAKADDGMSGDQEADAVDTAGDDDGDGTTDADNEGSIVDEDAKSDG